MTSQACSSALPLYRFPRECNSIEDDDDDDDIKLFFEHGSKMGLPGLLDRFEIDLDGFGEGLGRGLEIKSIHFKMQVGFLVGLCTLTQESLGRAGAESLIGNPVLIRSAPQ